MLDFAGDRLAEEFFLPEEYDFLALGPKIAEVYLFLYSKNAKKVLILELEHKQQPKDGQNQTQNEIQRNAYKKEKKFKLKVHLEFQVTPQAVRIVHLHKGSDHFSPSSSKRHQLRCFWGRIRQRLVQFCFNFLAPTS